MTNCRYPHCCCTGSCTYGGEVPKCDPNVPLFGRDYLTELAGRHDLAIKIEGDPGFHLSKDDMRAIAFSLRFTAERLGGVGETADGKGGVRWPP